MNNSKPTFAHSCTFSKIFKDFIYLFLERGEGRKKERERNINACMRDTSTSCHSHAPNWGPGLKPRHVLWLRIEPETFQFTGQGLVWPLSHTSQGHSSKLLMVEGDQVELDWSHIYESDDYWWSKSVFLITSFLLWRHVSSPGYRISLSSIAMTASGPPRPKGWTWRWTRKDWVLQLLHLQGAMHFRSGNFYNK